MDKSVDPNGSETCVGERVWRLARTASLLMGASVSGVLMVNLPTPFIPAAKGEERAVKSRAAAADVMLGTERSDIQGSVRATPVESIGAPTIERERTRPRRQPRGIQLASLGRDSARPKSIGSSLSGGAVRWSASSACLNAALRRLVGEVAASFGPVTVNSTCRSHDHNARVGGARHSHHLNGNAADFRISGNTRAALAFLTSHRSVGGLKHYGGGLFHIDTGPRRTW